MTLKLKNLYVWAIAAVVLAAIAGASFYVYSHPSDVVAAAAEFQAPCQTAPATTTQTFFSPGRATTTVPCRLATGSIAQGTGIGVNGISATFVAVASSSALTQFSFTPYWSWDNINFYPDLTATVVNATSTQISGTPANFRYSATASTTDPFVLGNGLVGTGATSTGTFEIPNPGKAPFLKLLITMPVGSANGSIQLDLRPRRDLNY